MPFTFIILHLITLTSGEAYKSWLLTRQSSTDSCCHLFLRYTSDIQLYARTASVEKSIRVCIQKFSDWVDNEI